MSNRPTTRTLASLGAGVAVLGAAAAIAVPAGAQTATPIYTIPTTTVPGGTTTTPGTTTVPATPPLVSKNTNAREARDKAYARLRSRASGRALRAGRTITITIRNATPGKYTVRIKRGDRTLAQGSKTLGGTVAATVRIRIKATTSGRRALRRFKARTVKTALSVNYKRPGSKNVTSKRNLRLRIR